MKNIIAIFILHFLNLKRNMKYNINKNLYKKLKDIIFFLSLFWLDIT